MFTKNIKLIGIVALIVVIVMVLSAVIAINNDKKVAGQIGSAVENAGKTYEEKIEELQKIIDALKGDQSKTEAELKDALAKLEEAGIKLENWDAATEIVISKLEEASDIFYGYVSDDNFDALYGYVVEETETEVVYAYDAFDGILDQVMYDLLRATSVEEMDAIIEGLEADLAAIPTVVDAIEAALAELEEDEIVYEDVDALMALSVLLFDVANDSVFAPATEEAPGQQEVLVERFNALVGSFKTVLVENFVEVAGTLPEADQVLYAHKDVIEGLMADTTLITNLLTDEEREVLYDDEEFVALVNNYVACVDRLAVVVEIYDDAVELNAWLTEQGTDKEIKADRATRDWLTTLYTAVADWADGRVVVDTTADDYIAEIHNYVDHSIIAGYETALAEAAGEMATKSDEFVAYVDGLGKITNESGDALKGGFDLYGEFIATVGTYSPEDVDYILNTVEGGVVDAWAALNAGKATHDYLVAQIKAFETLVGSVIIDCTCPADAAACTCDAGKIDEALVNATVVANADALVIELLGYYGLEESIFNADVFAAYKAIRVIDDRNAALARAAAASLNSQLTAEETAIALEALKGYINAAAAKEYELVVELVCVDPTNEEHVCDCHKNVANYQIAKDAVTTALEAYSDEFCAGFFTK